MFESDDIINYLYDAYGPGADKVPFTLKGGFATTTATFAAMARGMAGARVPPNARGDLQQMDSIELYVEHRHYQVRRCSHPSLLASRTPLLPSIRYYRRYYHHQHH